MRERKTGPDHGAAASPPRPSAGEEHQGAGDAGGVRRRTHGGADRWKSEPGASQMHAAALLLDLALFAFQRTGCSPSAWGSSGSSATGPSSSSRGCPGPWSTLKRGASVRWRVEKTIQPSSRVNTAANATPPRSKGWSLLSDHAPCVCRRWRFAVHLRRRQTRETGPGR